MKVGESKSEAKKKAPKKEEPQVGPKKNTVVRLPGAAAVPNLASETIAQATIALPRGKLGPLGRWYCQSAQGIWRCTFSCARCHPGA